MNSEAMQRIEYENTTTDMAELSRYGRVERFSTLWQREGERESGDFIDVRGPALTNSKLAVKMSSTKKFCFGHLSFVPVLHLRFLRLQCSKKKKKIDCNRKTKRTKLVP